MQYATHTQIDHFHLIKRLYLFINYFWLFLGLGSSSKTFMGPIYIDQQLFFWKYSSILLLWNFPGGGWLDFTIIIKTKSPDFDIELQLTTSGLKLFRCSFTGNHRVRESWPIVTRARSITPVINQLLSVPNQNLVRILLSKLHKGHSPVYSILCRVIQVNRDMLMGRKVSFYTFNFDSFSVKRNSAPSWHQIWWIPATLDGIYDQDRLVNLVQLSFAIVRNVPTFKKKFSFHSQMLCLITAVFMPNMT